MQLTLYIICTILESKFNDLNQDDRQQIMRKLRPTVFKLCSACGVEDDGNMFMFH